MIVRLITFLITYQHLSEAYVVNSDEESTPSSLLGPRDFNHHPFEAGQYLREVESSKNGPVLFPNDAPPPPRPPLIVTSRPLAESIARSELNSSYSNSLESDNQIHNLYNIKRQFKLKPVYEGAPNLNRVDLETNSDKNVYFGINNSDVEQANSLPIIVHANESEEKNLGQSSDNKDESSNYAFSYTVRDQETGDDFSHTQQSRGVSTDGEYRVRLPDGRIQIVSYTADEKGYNAKVRYEESDKQPSDSKYSFLNKRPPPVIRYKNNTDINVLNRYKNIVNDLVLPSSNKSSKKKIQHLIRNYFIPKNEKGGQEIPENIAPPPTPPTPQNIEYVITPRTPLKTNNYVTIRPLDTPKNENYGSKKLPFTFYLHGSRLYDYNDYVISAKPMPNSNANQDDILKYTPLSPYNEVTENDYYDVTPQLDLAVPRSRRPKTKTTKKFNKQNSFYDYSEFTKVPLEVMVTPKPSTKFTKPTESDNVSKIFYSYSPNVHVKPRVSPLPSSFLRQFAHEYNDVFHQTNVQTHDYHDVTPQLDPIILEYGNLPSNFNPAKVKHAVKYYKEDEYQDLLDNEYDVDSDIDKRPDLTTDYESVDDLPSNTPKDYDKDYNKDYSFESDYYPNHQSKFSAFRNTIENVTTKSTLSTETITKPYFRKKVPSGNKINSVSVLPAFTTPKVDLKEPQSNPEDTSNTVLIGNRVNNFARTNPNEFADPNKYKTNRFSVPTVQILNNGIGRTNSFEALELTEEPLDGSTSRLGLINSLSTTKETLNETPTGITYTTPSIYVHPRTEKPPLGTGLTPKSYLESTISNLKERINHKPVLNESFKNKIFNLLRY